MKIVVDANTIISALVSHGITRKVFLLNFLLDKYEFVAPELLIREIKKRKKSLIEETGIPEEEFDKLLKFLLSQIDTIPAKLFIKFLPKAKKICRDPKDKEYVALALGLNCPVLSGDQDLKVIKEIKVYSPRELLEEMLRNNI